MPYRKSKTLNYLLENKKNLILILSLVFLNDILSDPNLFIDDLILATTTLILAVATNLIILGYGLEVTRSVIYESTCLPDIKIKKTLIMGIKFLIVNASYLLIQAVVLRLISDILNFPDFELEQLLLDFGDTLGLFLTHNFTDTIIFIVLGIILTYITTFFMEIALAKLADGESLIQTFNIKDIKQCIDEIGWKFYTIDYTKIIISILILAYLRFGFHYFHIFGSVIDLILGFLIFIIEFVGIGYVYRQRKVFEDLEKNR